MTRVAFVLLLVLCVYSVAHRIPRQFVNDGIHLAVTPKCGPLSGKKADVNAGLDLTRYMTIVSFGDSYTDGGKHDGSALDPPILESPNPCAGGRSTNGKNWIENIADGIGARLMDYAMPSAVTNISLWPSNPRPADLLGETETFLKQSNNLDPETTLYTMFFGINDYEDSKVDGDHQLATAAQVIINRIKVLSGPPTNASSFLVTDVYGRGTHTAAGDAYVQRIFDGLSAIHKSTLSLNVAFVDFSRIWDGVLGTEPGYKAFGYSSTSSCANDWGGWDSWCDDPDHSFYWIPGHPSKQTMRIMADYVEEVLIHCRVA